MTSMNSTRNAESRNAHLASAWGVAGAAFIVMQGALMLSDPGVCRVPHVDAGTRPAKSDLAIALSPDRQEPVGKAAQERYYRCVERPAEKPGGSFVIALACVWPGEDSSAGG